MLTPIDIRNKDFKRSFRGYNEDEIDEFLDQIINDYEKLYRQNKQFQDELALNKKSLDQYHQLEKNLQDTLLVAQKTAEEVVNAAKSNAEEMRSNVEQECENRRQETAVLCQKKREEASAQVREIVAEYERIAQQKQHFITKLRTLLQTELSLLDEEKEEALPELELPAETEADEEA